MIEPNRTNPVSQQDPLSWQVFLPASQLLTVLARVEPKLEALCAISRDHMAHEYWFHDDTPAMLKKQRKAWRRVESDIWRLSWNLITLGYTHRCRVLDGIPPEDADFVRSVLGLTKEGDR